MNVNCKTLHFFTPGSDLVAETEVEGIKADMADNEGAASPTSSKC